jgi:hypothetical protein
MYETIYKEFQNYFFKNISKFYFKFIQYLNKELNEIVLNFVFDSLSYHVSISRFSIQTFQQALQ